MLIFRKVSNYIHYYLDILNITKLDIKIDQFIFDHSISNFIVVYRIGRQKLLNKMSIHRFEQEYFDKVSNYDQHRLTKFTTIEYILKNLFTSNICNKEIFEKFINQQVRNEQLF